MFFCGNCKHWEDVKQPSGTGFCKECNMQKDKIDMCSCFKSTDFGDKICFERKDNETNMPLL